MNQVTHSCSDQPMDEINSHVLKLLFSVNSVFSVANCFSLE